MIYFAQTTSPSREREVTSDVVIDVDANGAILGVEVLDALSALEVDPREVRPLSEGSVRVSHDCEADALYLRFRAGVSKEQHVVEAILSQRGSLLSVDVGLEGIAGLKM